MFQPLSASVFMYWRVITFNILLNSFGIQPGQPGQPGQLMVDTGSWCPTMTRSFETLICTLHVTWNRRIVMFKHQVEHWSGCQGNHQTESNSTFITCGHHSLLWSSTQPGSPGQWVIFFHRPGFQNFKHDLFWMFLSMFTLVGGFNPSEKYESQLALLFPIYGKIENMFPSHQAVHHVPSPRMRTEKWPSDQVTSPSQGTLQHSSSSGLSRSSVDACF